MRSGSVYLGIRVSMAGLIGLAGIIGSAQAQNSNAWKTLTEPATVALVETLPQLGDAGRAYQALIIRRRDTGDVILLPQSTASGELLDLATRTLLKVRTQQLAQGDGAGTYRGQLVDEITI